MDAEIINFLLILILFIAILIQYAKLHQTMRHFNDLDFLYSHDTKKQLTQIDKLNNDVDNLVKYSELTYGKKKPTN